MSEAGAAGAALNAAVDTATPSDVDAAGQRQRELYADEAERAVEVIEQKLAGIKESLAAAKAEAKRARAEANRGAE